MKEWNDKDSNISIMSMCPNTLKPVPEYSIIDKIEIRKGVLVEFAYCYTCDRRVVVENGKYIDHEMKYESVINHKE